jgi:hypothetical protein
MNETDDRGSPARGKAPEPPEVDVVIEVPRGSFLKRGSTGHLDSTDPTRLGFPAGPQRLASGLARLVARSRAHSRCRANTRIPGWARSCSRTPTCSIQTPKASVIDCEGRMLMPGLIDCHVHVLLSEVSIIMKAGRFHKNRLAA